MNAILSALICLARRTGLFTEAEATAAYNGLWRKLTYALIACAVAFLLNAKFGMKQPSIYLALIFAIVAFYVWAKPLHVLGVASTGLAAKIATHADLADEVKKVLGIYLGILQWVLIVGGVFLLTTGTFSFKGNAEAGLRLLVALGVVGLFIWKWPEVFVGSRGRRFFFTSALLIAVFSFASIIPGPVWVKYTGWDPLTAKSTSTEDSLYRLEHARQEIADTDRATELERITDKVTRREALTQAEEQFIADARQSQSKEKPSGGRRTTRAEVPLASMPQSSWPKLVVPAGGKSELIPIPPSMRIVMAGNRFVLHTVYVDGRDCSFEESGICPAGAYAGSYAKNKAMEQNIVSYAFAPMSE